MVLRHYTRFSVLVVDIPVLVPAVVLAHWTAVAVVEHADSYHERGNPAADVVVVVGHESDFVNIAAVRCDLGRLVAAVVGCARDLDHCCCMFVLVGEVRLELRISRCRWCNVFRVRRVVVRW